MTIFRSILCALLLVPLAGRAVDAVVPVDATSSSRQNGMASTASFNDNIDRTDPNFVKASLLIMGPGESLYSCAGHACFRLECPKFDLDYCFSYESEGATDRVLSFLAGNLKMGMFAVPTAEFLKEYQTDCRGIFQYELNLPPTAKQRLWKHLDDKVAEGAELSYDFIHRGCAQSTLKYLLEAVRPAKVEHAAWSPKYEKTLRELFVDALTLSPWNLFVLQALVGIDVDADLPKMRRVIIPGDLVEFLKGTTVDGVPILKGSPSVLLQQTNSLCRPWFTPVVAASCVLVLAVASWFVAGTAIDCLFLAFQVALGLFLIYLVFVSKLPATTWNWLLIPFNPLPLVFWHWRRHWALLFVVILVAWEGYMLFNGHALTDPAFLILTAALIVLYARITCLPAFLGRARTPAAPQKGVTA